LNINYISTDIKSICLGDFLQNPTQELIHSIAYDTRKIHQGKSTLFACLKSENNNGHKFIGDAYEKGVRVFLIDEKISVGNYKEATFIKVPSVIEAIQRWAAHHRKLFNIPVIGITGSAGKTTVKEWLYHLLSDNFVVARSPKSFNSQLGVALSIFEINELTEIALIEAGISQKDEMLKLEKMIQPTIGVFTSFGLAHRENFTDEVEHFQEKSGLFKSCTKIFVPEIYKKTFGNLSNVEYSQSASSAEESNINLIRLVAQNLGLSQESIDLKIQSLPKIALRMESLDGINQNLLLFDAYNWNLDGLEQALGYQLSISKKRDRFFILSEISFSKIDELGFEKLANRFSLKKQPIVEKSILVYGTTEIDDVYNIENSVILFKGAQPEIKRLASRMKVRNHSTFVEINLPALKHNIAVWKSRIPKSCQLLAMVKAQSYGAELTKISEFLTHEGISFLGVAYVDEGVELRKSGVELPIMVMNSDVSTWQDCIQFKLEPSVYSFEQMEALVRELIHEGIDHFPIHLKFDTGMHRLGFQIDELQKVIQYLKAQPELKVQSVFSHLADADNLDDDSFTLSQLKQFQHITEILQKSISYPILRHILNSEGLSNYPEYSFDMVRLGIGMFGISSNSKLQDSLQEVLSWKSTISQIKTIQIGDSVGYSKTFIAERITEVAIIPVGYADGFSRLLSNGKGGVFVNGTYFPTIGRLCMDMLMIDCTDADLTVGAEVEIIGKNQTIRDFAEKCNTIPYEIMTKLSSRMPRVFIEEID
jgi:alanine racemase